RAGSELMFTHSIVPRTATPKAEAKKPIRSPWKAAEQNRPLVAANARAKIEPPTTFHALRHTWASHAVMNGVPLMVVARNLGHTTTRMVERHYGHLAPSYVRDEIRKRGPRFGAKVSNVRSLDAARAKRARSNKPRVAKVRAASS